MCGSVSKSGRGLPPAAHRSSAAGHALAVGHLQFLHAVEPTGAQAPGLLKLADVRHPIGDRLEDEVDLQASEVGAQAEVRAAATEAEMRVGAAGDVEALRLVEDLLVEVGRAVEQAQPLPGQDLLSPKDCVHLGGALEDGHRRGPAYDLV